MTQRIDPEFAGNLLSSLEDLELPLLSWGVTDGALSEDEVLEAIDTALAARPDSGGTASGDIRDFLQNQALLFRVPGSSPPRYRTRLAEALRLTAQLRQLFPPRGAPAPQPDWWQAGRRLVADYRLHAAARRYPRWDVPAARALSSFAADSRVGTAARGRDLRPDRLAGSGPVPGRRHRQDLFLTEEPAVAGRHHRRGNRQRQDSRFLPPRLCCPGRPCAPRRGPCAYAGYLPAAGTAPRPTPRCRTVGQQNRGRPDQARTPAAADRRSLRRHPRISRCPRPAAGERPARLVTPPRRVRVPLPHLSSLRDGRRRGTAVGRHGPDGWLGTAHLPEMPRHAAGWLPGPDPPLPPGQAP